jgi:hypothetical protein
MHIHELEKQIECSTDTALPVNFQRSFLFAFAEAYFTRQVDVPCRYQPGVNEAIESTFADHQGIAVVAAYMMNRLTLKYQLRNDGIHMAQFIFG